MKELARQGKLPHKYSSHIDRPESKVMIRVYLKMAYSISRILNQSSQILHVLRENKERLIRIILRYQKSINLTILLRICGISHSVFYNWKSQVLNKCESSPLKLCRRKYPNQLTQQEINRMKKLLIDHRFRYWPVNSIAYYARRNNIVKASLNTWYNYIKTLGLNHSDVLKKKKYPTGIRAGL